MDAIDYRHAFTTHLFFLRYPPSLQWGECGRDHNLVGLGQQALRTSPGGHKPLCTAWVRIAARWSRLV